MGLTMAEIMVLLLFVLLLLFGLRLRKEEAQAKDALVFPGSTMTLGAVAQDAGLLPDKIPDNFKELVLGGLKAALAAASLGLPGDKQSVEQVAKDAALGRALREGLGANRVGVKPEDAVRDFLVEASKRYSADSTVPGGPGSAPIWLGGLEPKPSTTGDGPRGVLPPCARTSAGKAAMVLTADLQDQSIILSDNDMASMRLTAPAAEGLFAAVQRGKPLSDSDFLVQTQAVFDWSVAQNCRFYVYVVDKTGTGAKKAYKDRLKIVEGHFYKLLADDREPSRR